METEEWKKYPPHEKICKWYCEDCKVLFCGKCEDHEEHKTSYVKRYVIKHEKELPLAAVLTSISPKIRDAIESIKSEGISARNECNEAEETIKALNPIVENPAETVESDLDVLNKARVYLREAEDKIRTSEGKKACKKSIEDLNVEGKIREEVESAGQRKKELCRELVDKNNKIKELGIELLQLEKVKSELEGEMDGEGKFLLLMLRDKGILDLETVEEMGVPEESGNKVDDSVSEKNDVETKYCINTTIEKFRVFDNVEKVFDIDKVMKQPLVDVGEGIQMSRPVNVELDLKTGGNYYVNISHNGVIAMIECNNSEYYLQLNKFFTKMHVAFRVEDWTSTAFYDDNIIVITDKRKLREASLDSLFTTPNTDTLKTIGYDELYNTPPNTLTQQTRRAYYINIDNDLYEHNVDTKVSERINVRCLVKRIASSGGINIGVKCVFKSQDDNKIYALKMDNSVEYVNEGKEDYIPKIYPSSSDNENLDKALYNIGGKNFHYKEKVMSINFSSSIFYGHAAVRIYKDIFLTYSKDQGKWLLVRIIVP